MSSGRWLAVALVAGSLVTVPLGATGGASTVRGSDVPDGLVDGAPHVLRLRPRLAKVSTAPRKVTRRQAAEGEAAVASCDPARVTALSRVPSTPRADDVASACVVLAEPDARDRALLGASRVSGDGIQVVSRRRAGKGRYEVVLRMTVRGATQTLETPPALADLPQALDLDGEIVGDATIEGSPQGTTAAIVLSPPGKAGFRSDAADELIGRIRHARNEQLIDLARQAGMSRRGRELLADTVAAVDDKDEFNRDCPNPETAETLVLGCYTGDRIYVLRVDRPDLTGVMTVSLAHEMLHAAFDDLSRSERRDIVERLEAFMTETGDPRIEDLLVEYERLEPGARGTELHSLVGTQVADLPRPLERHYRTLFADRAKTVEAFTAYQSIFDGLQARYDELLAQAESLEAQIAETEAAYTAAGAEADRLFDQITALRNQDRIDESNALVDAQNAAADRANGLVDHYNGLVSQYNTVVDEINLLAVALNESYNAISPVPIELPIEG